MIPSSTIDDIRNRTDILQVVGENVPLKKRGKNYIGLCPFHSEKTPSFTVSTDKQIFHCFGCGEGGNVFAFIMKMENVSFAEAVQMLGERLGIAVRSDSRSPAPSGEKEKHLAIMELAQKYFRENLEGPGGKPAKEYLDKRGITAASVNAFELGYAPERWDGLYDFLFKKGVLQKDMEKLGLIIERNDKSGFYDRFRARLMFPIYDTRGRVIGFGGRMIAQGTAEDAKYINSPDSPIYNKGFSLYGIKVTKDEIKRSRSAVLVEGNIDLISCWQFGIKNVIAPLGTALTQSQAKMIHRFAEKVIIAFDRDSAGAAATERSVEILKDEGLNVYVANYEGGKDPDEAIRAAGPEKFLEAIEKSLPWVEYKISAVTSKHNLHEIEGRAKAVKDAAAIIGQEKDELVQKGYIKLLAGKLGFSYDEVASEVKRLGFYVDRKENVSLKRSVEKPSSKLVKAEECLIKLSVENKDILDMFRQNLGWQEFTGNATKMMAELMLSVEIEAKDMPHFLLENLPDEEVKKHFSRIMMNDYPAADAKKVANDCINTIKAHHLKSKMEHLRGEIIAAEKEGRHDNVSLLHKEFRQANDSYRSLSI